MNELEKLRNRKDKLNYLKNLVFENEEEYKTYLNTNKQKFHELRDIENRIREIEWEVLTAKQKKQKRLELLKLAEKFDEKRNQIFHQKNYIHTLDLLYDALMHKGDLDRDSIFILTELLQLLESKPFGKIEFFENITKEVELKLKTNYNNLYNHIKLL